MKLSDILTKRLVFCDGGMGTVLQSLGLPPGKRADSWSIEEPEKVKAVHRAYLDAGCDVITANTFGAAVPGDYEPEQLVAAGLKNVREAIEDSGRDALAALDLSTTAQLLEPLGGMTFEEAYDRFARVVRCGAQSGADLILIETMTDPYEIKAALLAAKENSTLPVGVTFTVDEGGRLLNGADIITAAAQIESLGADFVGLNCGFGPDKMVELAPTLLGFTKLPVLVNPNAGLPVVLNGQTTYTLTPDDFAEKIAELVRLGCAAVGGCCGTTPAHLKAVVDKCRHMPLRLPDNSARASFVSSRTKTVFFENKTVLIGERLNPTGKPRLKEALLSGRYEYLREEAVNQEQAGADVLDVNVGVSGVNEPEALTQAVRTVQGVSQLPVQIDTGDPAALEQALRICCGKPLINSVNGSEASLSHVLPLAKKYGAMLVCLTLDENGIPDSAQERVAIAERIITRCDEIGISRDNIIIDPLTMTVSTDSASAVKTLAAVDEIRHRLGVHTVLGVSNISFGLPCREKVNAAFFAAAMQRGLSAGIINPMNAALMEAYHTHNVLTGADDGCAEYIALYADAVSEQTAPRRQTQSGAVGDLSAAVIGGMPEQACRFTEQLLADTAALDVINGHLVPALDEVGRLFEQKKLFLPQLLNAAKTAAACFDVIKQRLQASGEQQQKKAKVILATVKGDVHDIGKNIVKVLLENYGYEVIDLGKDVEPAAVVDCCLAQNVPLVGLSALMTTTLPAMKDTVALLRQKCDCKIMVGGAVLTEEYAKEIGADFYGKDAMCAVRYAEELFN